MAWLIKVVMCALLPHVLSQVMYENKMRHRSYHYVIIGAGSSGSAIANRLSENGRYRVLLLEAGGIPPALSDIPLLSYELARTDVDWQYKTIPQKHACLAYPNQMCPIGRGKALGGSSVTNSMIYVRGNKEDFNQWAQQGAKGWTYDEVLYYFLKSEDQTNQTLLQNGYHAAGGPQTLSTTEFYTPIRDIVIQAGAESGYDIVDYNGANQLGFGYVQSTTRDGLRCSTEKAYLRPAAERNNLDILYNAFVTKINIRKRVARSVSFNFQGAPRTVRASREIILSAGAIGSPQILMLSGIGPKNHLEDLNIPLVVDLPVGENFQDHVREQGLPYYFNQSVGIVYSRDINQKAYDELKEGKGPLTVPAGLQVLAFFRSKYQDENDERPDVEFHMLTTIFDPDSKKLENDTSEDVFSIYPVLLRPDSRGVIKLNTSNPYDYPLIDAQFLEQEKDLLRLVEGIKIAKSVMKASVIQELQPELRRARVPGCDTPDMDSDEYLQCVARALTHTSAHACCTCKMGNRKDPTTVVDQNLRVKGVRKLRVADASIMPFVTSGNTNGPAIMIGEKAADLILGRKWDPIQGKVVRNLE